MHPEALFEFLIFLQYSIHKWCGYKFTELHKEINELNYFIKESGNSLEITIRNTETSKSKIVKQKEIIKALLSTVYASDIKYSMNNILKIQHEKGFYTRRHESYLLVKTLIDNLPIKKKEGVQFTNKERLLYLCILYLCGYQSGEEVQICNNENNVSFNQ